jgi:hypothetical protein
MSTDQEVKRDERTVAVENACYKWAYIFVVFALLVDGAYRGLVYHEAAWDLLALALVPALVCTVYQQAWQKILGPGWLKAAVLIMVLGAVLGIITVVILRTTRAM